MRNASKPWHLGVNLTSRQRLNPPLDSMNCASFAIRLMRKYMRAHTHTNKRTHTRTHTHKQTHAHTHNCRLHNHRHHTSADTGTVDA